MKILTIGCGHIGLVLAKDLAENMSSSKIVISDSDETRVKEFVKAIDKDNIDFLHLSDSKHENLVNTLRKFDLAVGLAPGRAGYKTVKACMEAGVDVVDLSFMPEDPLTLNNRAVEADVSIIPDCGVAPGLSNILVGRASSLLDSVEEAIILVGGVPEKPVPPLGYKVTWCVEDLLEEYTRKVKIVKDGKLVEEEALNGLELVDFPGVGKFEAFFTDGLRTLHSTIKGVENMWEKTLRYPGHAEKIKLLKGLGFFDESSLIGVGVSPRELSIKLLEQKLSLKGSKDLLLMNVKVRGMDEDSRLSYTYHLIDRYDEMRGVTAMARTTAYTASIVIQLLAKKMIKQKGVVPPEKLGMNDYLFKEIMTELKKRGINIKEKIDKMA